MGFKSRHHFIGNGVDDINVAIFSAESQKIIIKHFDRIGAYWYLADQPAIFCAPNSSWGDIRYG